MAAMRFPMKEMKRHNRTTAPQELGDFITPFEKTFVVYHLGIPWIDPDEWRLSIEGLVDRPRLLALADLLALPAVQVNAFHECAGSPLRPTTPVRRVANVAWKGVRLNTVLDMAGIRPEARYAWFQGADSGVYPPTGVYNECYLKDLPLDKVLNDEVLLATELNGVPLTEERGAPVRLVVPGYYGTNSVKWLTEIRLEDRRANAYFSSELYNDHVTKEGVARKVSVWSVAPNSLIVTPRSNTIHMGENMTIWGWAWGASEIRTVEVSTDNGTTWRTALMEKRKDHCWQRFSIDWSPEQPGEYCLASRATDGAGQCQPDQGARNEIFRATVQVMSGARIVEF